MYGSLVTTTRPAIQFGTRIRVRFLHQDGEVESQYEGTVAHADSHGVDLTDVRCFDSTLTAECGADSDRYDRSEIGVAWPARGDVRVFDADESGPLCPCGKAAGHINAHPDTTEWACRVPVEAVGGKPIWDRLPLRAVQPNDK